MVEASLERAPSIEPVIFSSGAFTFGEGENTGKHAVSDKPKKCATDTRCLLMKTTPKFFKVNYVHVGRHEKF